MEAPLTTPAPIEAPMGAPTGPLAAASTASIPLYAAQDADLLPETLVIDRAFVRKQNEIYDAVMAEFPTSVGKSVSKKERDDTNQHQSTLVYGEINFESFGIAFEKIKKKYGKPGTRYSGPQGILQGPGGKFYDLGSGTGKPAIAAAILHPFDYCGGVEILEGLHNTSLQVLEAFNDVGRPLLDASQDTRVEFIHGDATDLSVKDWSDADVVFANSTCFDDVLMGKIALSAANMKRGAFFITLTKRLPSPHFFVHEYETYQMSWGGATVYIQQKTSDSAPNGIGGFAEPAVENNLY